MKKAFVDTSVLADVLFKPKTPQGKAAKEALKSYDRTLLPVYAIKELKAGILNNYVWLYNRLTESKSFWEVFSILYTESRSLRRNRLSTALEALSLMKSSIAAEMNNSLKQRYGVGANEDSVMSDEVRYRLRRAVTNAWKNRRSVTTEVIQPLSCYEEIDPTEERGLLINKPIKCKAGVECCMANALRANVPHLEKLRDASAVGEPAAHQTRHKILKDLCRKRIVLDDNKCRSLGDAIFAFFSPDDATILTTNMKDHEPLANALGKRAARP
jgi:predicted nucleic acid-binding protein